MHGINEKLARISAVAAAKKAADSMGTTNTNTLCFVV